MPGIDLFTGLLSKQLLGQLKKGATKAALETAIKNALDDYEQARMKERFTKEEVEAQPEGATLNLGDFLPVFHAYGFNFDPDPVTVKKGPKRHPEG